MENHDSFMQTFKYYKSNKHKPSLEKVILVENCNFTDEVENIELNIKNDSRSQTLGLQAVSRWKIFSLKKHPGFIIIRNPFTTLGQRYWIRECLENYSKRPNKRNIDIDTRVDDWWKECFINNQCDRKLQKKLRWTTLGYHHNWNTKIYTEDNKGTFPMGLAELTDVVAQCFGYETFKAEAAIVNYYHMGSTLSAHTDHSEVNLDAPLFSFSFGQTAIFLLGGYEKSVDPSAILLRSGDIGIMSKEARLSYHAVPKILPSNLEPWNSAAIDPIEKSNALFKYIDESEIIEDMNKTINNQDWSKFQDYVQESRININVRQVLNENQNNL